MKHDGHFKGSRGVRDLICLRNQKVFLILISVLFLGGCAQGSCCKTGIERISQTDDLQYLTYTVRVRYSSMCDIRKVKVEVKIPISLESEKAPGETWTRTHDVGRLRARQSKRETFTIETAGALVEKESLKIKLKSYRGYVLCARL